MRNPSYENARALVAGGLGYVGSNLAIRLVELGSDVTVVDALIQDHGGNRFNIEPVQDRVRLEIADLRDRPAIAELVAGHVVIFNLAGQVSHIDSMTDPIGDLAAAIVAVHLYGRPAPIEALAKLGVPVVEDCAQAHGLKVKSGLGCFSFYPTKNLGAFGDGGAVATSDSELAERVRSLRVYGEGPDGRSTRPGLNSRLDELQAAFLRVRLQRLVRSPQRDELRDALRRAGIETGVHYRFVLSDHPAFSEARRAANPEASEAASREVLSLPCYAQLSRDEEHQVAEEIETLRARFEVR